MLQAIPVFGPSYNSNGFSYMVDAGKSILMTNSRSCYLGEGL